LLLIPDTVAEEAPEIPNELPPSRRPENSARSLDNTDYYGDEYDVSDDDLDAAEALVFRPLFRYRKHGSRRRVDKHDRPSRNKDPYRRIPFRYCPPCRYYFY
jgi:hypothetical protein